MPDATVDWTCACGRKLRITLNAARLKKWCSQACTARPARNYEQAKQYDKEYRAGKRARKLAVSPLNA